MSVLVLDNTFDADAVAQAAAEWPAADWAGWVRYNSPLERKLACADWPLMTSSRKSLFAEMQTLHMPSGSVPDATLYGAGMQSMSCGDHLDLHLDADRHPILGLERRANAILFLDDWREEWGGAFELWAPDLSRCVQRIFPARNRLLIFEATDTSYHGVTALTCPPEVQRKSLCVFWWSEPRGPSKRARAQFVARPGESSALAAIKQPLRLERMAAIR